MMSGVRGQNKQIGEDKSAYSESQASQQPNNHLHLSGLNVLAASQLWIVADRQSRFDLFWCWSAAKRKHSKSTARFEQGHTRSSVRIDKSETKQKTLRAAEVTIVEK